MRLIVILASLLSAIQASAAVTNISASRRVSCNAEVVLTGFVPALDQFDSGEVLGFGPFNSQGGADALISGLDKAETDCHMSSEFFIGPDVSAVFVSGFTATVVSVNDPGFASTSDGSSVSSFIWNFSVDEPTLYVVDLEVGASLSGSSAFGFGSFFEGLPVANVTLEAISAGSDTFAHVATDNIANGVPVTDSFVGYGVLEPGSYQLRAGSLSEGQCIL